MFGTTGEVRKFGHINILSSSLCNMIYPDFVSLFCRAIETLEAVGIRLFAVIASVLWHCCNTAFFGDGHMLCNGSYQIGSEFGRRFG